MRQVFLGFLIVGLLTGCAELGLDFKRKAKQQVPPDPAEAPTERVEVPAAAVPTTARTVEDFDTTTAQQRAEAAAVVPAAEVDLGVTIASLGSATEPGFWLKTPLVSTPAKGRVVYPENGNSVQVELIPIDGPKTAGSRMSLAALRLIEAPLTGLPEVRVYRTNR